MIEIGSLSRAGVLSIFSRVAWTNLFVRALDCYGSTLDTLRVPYAVRMARREIVGDGALSLSPTVFV